MICDIDAKRCLGSSHDKLGCGIPFADQDLGDASILSEVLVAAQGRDKLLLGEFRAETDDVDEILLNYTHVGQMLAVHGLEFLLFPLLLLLCLCKPLDLFSSHGLELYRLIRILATTCWTSSVQVLLDVMPAESADLVSTWAWLEVGVREIDLFQAQWAVHVLLHTNDERLNGRKEGRKGQ